MQKQITMTTLLRNPKKVISYIKKGFILKVYSNNKLIFDILPAKEETKNNNKHMIKDKDLPSFDFDLPDEISKKEIYEKFGK
ncbi:MAG: hypothetical protein GF332_01240 [Candidatus Moranbacteria bacterium]|nr:hypothetical protein [Candidatus Moranbacteria bacterium]